MPQKNSSRFSLRSVFISSWIIAMTLNFAAASRAEEPAWREMIWTGDVVQLKELEQICLEYGILSEDVFWANGHADTPPSGGEVLLIPKSKSAIVPVWMETQSRKNGRVEPLVTVKPHGVPLNMRAAKESPDLAPQDRPLIESSALTSRVRPLPDRSALSPDSSPALPARPLPPSPSSSSSSSSSSLSSSDSHPPAASPAKTPESKETLKNIRILVSGDEVLVLSGGVSGQPPAVSTDLVPPERPPVTTAPTTVPPSADPGKMTWPVSGKVSSGFGKRGKRHFHAGLDMPMPQGTPIQAAMDGVVLETASTKTPKYRGY
ncbi:MAG: hypothetical protein LBT15_01945, partial [Synergistaceae bacterium]|nr:hypothetical protein [Synergistaceae bacterium]